MNTEHPEMPEEESKDGKLTPYGKQMTKMLDRALPQQWRWRQCWLTNNENR